MKQAYKIKYNVKSTFRTALLAVAVAAATGSTLAQQLPISATAYADGDLIVGFTTGSGNDLVVNLGLQSVITNGNYWNLSSKLSTMLSGNSADYTEVQFGVFAVSDPNIALTNFVYATSGTTPPKVANLSAWNNAEQGGNLVGDLLNGTTGFGTPAYSANGNASWYGNTIGGGSSTLKQLYGAVCGPAGTNVLNFFAAAQGVVTTPPILGTFTLSTSGILTFNAAGTGTPPTITLNTPANNASYGGFATIPLSATVVSNNNAITSVQFYSGTTLLATASTPPYTANWSYVAPGSYPAVTARANYGSSLVVTSAVASVTVNALVTPVVGAPVKNGSGYSFAFTGSAGQSYTILTSTNLAQSGSWTVAVTNAFFNTAGSASFTNSTPNEPQRFYRVKSP